MEVKRVAASGAAKRTTSQHDANANHSHDTLVEHLSRWVDRATRAKHAAIVTDDVSKPKEKLTDDR